MQLRLRPWTVPWPLTNGSISRGGAPALVLALYNKTANLSGGRLS